MDIRYSVENSIDTTIDFLQKLIQIDTQQGEASIGCPFGDGPKKALEMTLNYCEELGFRVKNIDNYIGFAEIGEGEELIGIPMHLDVVSPGKGWTVEPFGGDIIGKNIYGRGAIDNKGSIAMLIHVLNNIKYYFQLNKRVRLIFGTNEESGMKCIKYYLDKKQDIPTIGFTPDAMYPLVNGEKGRLHLKINKKLYVEKESCFIILNGGTSANIVPSECKARIYNITTEEEKNIIKALEEKNVEVNVEINKNDIILTTNGISSHGSTPEKGENAICKLLLYLIEDNIGIQNIDDIRRICKYLASDYNGKELGIYTEDSVFKKSTVNLGIIKISEDDITVELDIRYGLNTNKEQIVKKIKEKFNNDWIVEIIEYKKLHYVEENNEVIKKLLNAYKSITGENGYCLTMGGGTYASFFDNMVAFGPKFINYKTGGHGVDERIPIDHIKINMGIYTKALLNLLDIY